MKLPSGLVPIVRVFQHYNYATYMGGMGPNLITLWMQKVGVGWLAWELTHSTIWLGVIAAADLAPVMILGPFAGAYIDRHDAVKMQRIVQFLMMLQSIALAVTMALGILTIELLFGLALFLGLIFPFSSTARHAIVPRTIPRDLYATGIAVDSSLFNGSRFVGPAIAGLMIPVTGVIGTFIANAIGHCFFFSMLALMRLPPVERKERKQRRMLGDIAEGVRFVRGHAGIGPLFVLLACVSVTIRPLQDMLPGFAGGVFQGGAVELAWLTSAMGVGAMSNAVWIAMRGHLTGLTLVMLRGCFVLGVAVLGFSVSPSFWIAVIFASVAGFCVNTISTSVQALTQSSLTDEKRGRVMGFYTMIYRGVPALGAFAMGLIAEWTGLNWTFGVAASLFLMASVWAALRYRTMRAALEGEHITQGHDARADA